MRSLVPLAVLLLAAACSQPPADTAGEGEAAATASEAAPARSSWEELPDAELTASATMAAEEYVPPPEPQTAPGGSGVSWDECMEVWQDEALCAGGEPSGGAPDSGGDGVPSVEEQIRQCTEQTGLPQECEDKIRHGEV